MPTVLSQGLDIVPHPQQLIFRVGLVLLNCALLLGLPIGTWLAAVRRQRTGHYEPSMLSGLKWTGKGSFVLDVFLCGSPLPQGQHFGGAQGVSYLSRRLQKLLLWIWLPPPCILQHTCCGSDPRGEFWTGEVCKSEGVNESRPAPTYLLLARGSQKLTTPRSATAQAAMQG